MPDVRLIDATRLHAQVFNDNGGDLSKTENVAQILLRIENAPTIDAQPVKRGRFVFEKGDYINTVDGYRCTSCGETYHTKVPYFSEYKFCPNCGAKMDVDADEQ